MLEGCGFEVKNIGIDVPSDKFVEAVKDYNADILCMSVLLTTAMTYMKDVILALEYGRIGARRAYISILSCAHLRPVSSVMMPASFLLQQNVAASQ